MVFYKESPIDRDLNAWIRKHTIALQIQKDFQKRLAAEEKRLAAEDQRRQREQGAWALSVRDWHADEQDRTTSISEVVNVLTAADPQRSQAIHDYLNRDGYNVVFGTLYLLADLANKGAVDLSKISVAWVVGWIIAMESAQGRLT